MGIAFESRNQEMMVPKLESQTMKLIASLKGGLDIYSDMEDGRQKIVLIGSIEGQSGVLHFCDGEGAALLPV